MLWSDPAFELVNFFGHSYLTEPVQLNTREGTEDRTRSSVEVGNISHLRLQIFASV